MVTPQDRAGASPLFCFGKHPWWPSARWLGKTHFHYKWQLLVMSMLNGHRNLCFLWIISSCASAQEVGHQPAQGPFFFQWGERKQLLGSAKRGSSCAYSGLSPFLGSGTWVLLAAKSSASLGLKCHSHTKPLQPPCGPTFPPGTLLMSDCRPHIS